MADEWDQYAAPAKDEWEQYASQSTATAPAQKDLIPQMTEGMKADHPILAGIDQTANDVSTLLYKATNGLSLGAVGAFLKSKGIAEPNFDNTAPENKSGLNLVGDVANLGAGAKTIGSVLGVANKVVSPVLRSLLKYESNLQQAQKSKDALDSIRKTLGQAKDLAVKDVADVPAELDFSGNKSQKVIDALKNPLYGVEFTEQGGVKGTIGNLDKAKTAIQDLIHSPRIWEEAPGIEQRAIKQFQGKISNAMRDASEKAGKPVGPALDAYSNFMDRYQLANKSVSDTLGNAMGNKLKETFKLNAEPAYKQAWKDLSSMGMKESATLKSVMDSMKRREAVKNLLKLSFTLEGGKRVITGHF